MFIGGRAGASLILGADGRFSSNRVEDTRGVVYRRAQSPTAGMFGELEMPIMPIASMNVRGGWNEQWAEAPITIHEGGRMTGATGHLYLFPRSRIVLFDLGAQLRSLFIDPQDPGGAPPEAQQRLFFGGVDFNLWSSPGRILRGEALDEKMLRRTYLTDAGVLSYRHYELFTAASPDFRIALAPRASIDNGTLAIRKVLFGGRLGFDIHGGIGYDNQRLKMLAQAGGVVVLSASWSSRLLASYDMSHETATGIPGTLHIGWLTYHADI